MFADWAEFLTVKIYSARAGLCISCVLSYNKCFSFNKYYLVLVFTNIGLFAFPEISASLSFQKYRSLNVWASQVAREIASVDIWHTAQCSVHCNLQRSAAYIVLYSAVQRTLYCTAQCSVHCNVQRSAAHIVVYIVQGIAPYTLLFSAVLCKLCNAVNCSVHRGVQCSAQRTSA